MNRSESATEMEQGMFTRPTTLSLVSPTADGPTDIEDQLAEVIRSAREVAASAEELLRELAAQEHAARMGRPSVSSKAVALAPRLLDATQQQLVSVLAMLRTM